MYADRYVNLVKIKTWSLITLNTSSSKNFNLLSQKQEVNTNSDTFPNQNAGLSPSSQHFMPSLTAYTDYTMLKFHGMTHPDA